MLLTLGSVLWLRVDCLDGVYGKTSKFIAVHWKVCTEQKVPTTFLPATVSKKYDRHNTSMPRMALASVRASPNMDHTNSFLHTMLYSMCMNDTHTLAICLEIQIYIMDYVWYGVFENSINVITNKNHLNRFRLTFRS